MKKSSFLCKVIAILVLSSLIFSFTGCEEKAAGSEMNNNESSVNSTADGNWQLVSYENSIIEKKLLTGNGREYSFSADLSNVTDNTVSKDLLDSCMTTLGQFFVSSIAFDFELHTPLFYEKYVENNVYSTFKKEGFTEESGTKNIAEKGHELFPYKSVRAEISISELLYNNAEIKSDLLKYNDFLEEYSLDSEKFGDVFAIYADIRLVYNDLFYDKMNFSLADDNGPLIVYEYDEKLYMHYKYLDDDLSIDLLESSIEDNSGCFKLKTTFGKITSIDDKYICLDGNKYYDLINYDEELTMNIGEYVNVTRYSFNIEFNRLSDDSECEYGVAVKIEKIE